MRAKILAEEPISIYDLKAELEKIKSRDKELGFRAAKVEEYLHNFAKADENKIHEIKKKIHDLAIPRLREEQVCKLIDIMPHDVEEVRLVLASYSITVTNENLAKIADVIKEHRK